MRKKAKALMVPGLLVLIVALVFAGVTLVQISHQVLDGGGAMGLTTPSYKLSSSLGQSLTGVQAGATKTVYTGFWNPWVKEMTPVEWEDELHLLPTEFSLSQNYPNPFNPTTTISYALPRACEVSIRIYNTLGQTVRDLLNQRQEPGYKTVQWDGKDDSGSEVSSGVYFYRMLAGDFTECRKMIILK